MQPIDLFYRGAALNPDATADLAPGNRIGYRELSALMARAG